jgi:hypothetical protein
MGASGQHHAPAALYSGERPPVLIFQEAGWATVPVWTQRLEEKSFRLCLRSNILRLVVQPVARHYTDWATRLTPCLCTYYLFVKTELWVYKICTTNYSRSYVCKSEESRWLGAVSDLIIKIYGASVFPQMLAASSSGDFPGIPSEKYAGNFCSEVFVDTVRKWRYTQRRYRGLNVQQQQQQQQQEKQ